ncbi:MAG TPA: hypothetical protein ACFYD3_01060 [Candidatus Hypogeohydataceae bacterium YC41]
MQSIYYQLWLSIGTAYYSPEAPSTLDELIEKADVLIYEQKRCKQNQQANAGGALKEERDFQKSP